LRQTSQICARPCVGASLFMKPLRPKEFASAAEMGEAAKKAIAEGYAILEARYKDWPLEHDKAA
jgi:hypothetical protein